LSNLGPNLVGSLISIRTAIAGQIGRLGRPMLVALDGGSGAGKSTLARVLADALEAVVVPLDDFYAAGIPDRAWDAMTDPERLAQVFDWNRLRLEALEPLLAGRPASWQPFDFESGLLPDGTYGLSARPVERAPASIILLEGAYAASPPLADLVDLAVLVDVPIAERHRRLAVREDQAFLARWHLIWDPVEAYYFEQVRPPDSFDLIVAGSQSGDEAGEPQPGATDVG